MTKKTNQNQSEAKLWQQLNEATADLQRVRADFENYRKRVDNDIKRASSQGQSDMIIKLLPIVDNIERSIKHLPPELATNNWAKGVIALAQDTDKMLADIGVTKIDAQPGQPFNPDRHHAVQFDDNSSGDSEVIAEELQPGYLLNGQVLREAMVRVKRQ
jgi:molecular chaperone GrpE